MQIFRCIDGFILSIPITNTDIWALPKIAASSRNCLITSSYYRHYHAYLSYITWQNVQNVHAIFNKSLASRGVKLHVSCQARKFYLSSSIVKKGEGSKSFNGIKVKLKVAMT